MILDDIFTTLSFLRPVNLQGNYIRLTTYVMIEESEFYYT